MRDLLGLSLVDMSGKLSYDKWTRHEVHAIFVINNRGQSMLKSTSHGSLSEPACGFCC